jgi:hypothetical protein
MQCKAGNRPQRIDQLVAMPTFLCLSTAARASQSASSSLLPKNGWLVSGYWIIGLVRTRLEPTRLALGGGAALDGEGGAWGIASQVCTDSPLEGAVTSETVSGAASREYDRSSVYTRVCATAEHRAPQDRSEVLSDGPLAC